MISSRAFAVPLGQSKNAIINIAEPDLRADNLYLTTWTSSFIMACQMHKLGLHVDGRQDIPILELGAGTGLVGLTAALLWQQKTVLTDLPGIVSGLRTNVDLNAAVLGPLSDSVQCGSLDWTSPGVLTSETGNRFEASQSKASMILAADTIYDELHPQLVSNVILTWLARTPSARAILTYPLRVAYLDQVREIWTVLEDAGMEADSHGQEQADVKDWDDECLCEWVVWKWKT